MAKKTARGEGEALLQAIVDNPFDDGVRLIYADWLDDHGEPERAEFIRIQCALAAGWEGEERAVLEKREKQILKTHGKKWAQKVRPTAVRWPFHRGFLFPHLDMTVSSFVQRDHKDLRFCPLWSLSPRGATEDMARLAQSQHLRPVSRLWLLPPKGSGDRLGPAIVDSISASAHLLHLRSLWMANAHLGEEGLVALARSPLLGNLTELNLCYVDATDSGVAALARSPLVARLENLSLRNNRQMTDEAIIALASSPHFESLSRLDLALNYQLGPESARALAASPYLKKFTSLELERGHLGDDVIASLQQRFGSAVRLPMTQ